MTTQIHVPLKRGWVDETEPNSGGVNAFFRNPSRSGPFQVSWWGVDRGQTLEVSEQKLKEMAAQFGEQQFGCGPAKETTSGPCALGSYGSAVFSAPPDRCHGQVWFLSKGTGFVLATYMSAEPPDSTEVEETRQMATEITVVDIQ